MGRQTCFPTEGGSDCGLVRYRVETAPLFANCCHCRWLQGHASNDHELV